MKTRILPKFILLFPIIYHYTSCYAFSTFLGQSLSLSKRGSYCSGDPITMKLRVGMLGLPNVGKSTLFNALARQSVAQAGNFPFCTIDPNIHQIIIPDPYLESLGELAGSTRTVPATIEWIDVAGLAKGAHRGEGLGNKFLATLRECRALCHITRVFQDDNVVHVDGKVDPVEDMDAISLELLYADLAHVERRLARDKVPTEERDALEQIYEGLQLGKPARALNLSYEQKFVIRSMGLLTLKPVLYAFNVDECDYVLDRDKITEMIQNNILSKTDYYDPYTDLWTLISAKLEAGISKLSDEEQIEYFRELGVDVYDRALLSYNQLPNLISQLLGLSLVYTGPGVPPERSKTTRAHLLSGSLTADGMAGRIHGEIQKGFIRAEVIPAQLLLEHSNYVAAKESGDIRSEGRDYELHNKDVVCIKWK